MRGESVGAADQTCAGATYESRRVDIVTSYTLPSATEGIESTEEKIFFSMSSVFSVAKIKHLTDTRSIRVGTVRRIVTSCLTNQRRRRSIVSVTTIVTRFSGDVKTLQTET